MAEDSQPRKTAETSKNETAPAPRYSAPETKMREPVAAKEFEPALTTSVYVFAGVGAVIGAILGGFAIGFPAAIGALVIGGLLGGILGLYFK